MKGTIIAITAIGVFGGLVFWALQPTEKPASLGNQIAAQQAQNATSPNTQAVKAVDYKLETFNGKVVTLSEVNSNKPVVIQIWATWCEICAQEFPTNNKIAQKYKDKIEYHAVNIGGSDQNPKAIENYVKRMNLDPDAIKFLVDMKSTVSQTYGFNSTPQHLFVAKGGEIKFFKPGHMRANEMEAQIESLLQEN